MRLIDADLLKKNIAKWLQGGDPQETEMVKLDDIAVSVIMEIDKQPTVCGWIPCSERLPDKDMWCWATFESGNVDKIYYFASLKWWNGEISDNRVVAWQPLPEPYKTDCER